jgi:hypothetical protein
VLITRVKRIQAKWNRRFSEARVYYRAEKGSNEEKYGGWNSEKGKGWSKRDKLADIRINFIDEKGHWRTQNWRKGELAYY